MESVKIIRRRFRRNVSEKLPKQYEKWPIWIRFFACDLEIDLPTLSIFWLQQDDIAMYRTSKEVTLLCNMSGHVI